MHTLALSAITLALAISVASPAHSEMEKIATVCKTGICTYWWPKLTPPDGWQHDRNHSHHYNFNAMAPTGKSFGDAETVMYANAVYKPRIPEAKTLSEFIINDHASFRRETPDLTLRPSGKLKTKDGKEVVTWLLEPKSSGQWERVAYFEESDYYMVFVVSSRTAAQSRPLSNLSPSTRSERDAA